MKSATTEKIVFHDGMADALGISEARLETLSLRDLAGLAYERGFQIKIENDGIAPGLTLRGGDVTLSNVGAEVA